MKPKTKQQLLDRMNSLGACDDATKWVQSREGTAQQIWDSCERGDWMLWYAGRCEVNRKQLVGAACMCAREALKHVQAGEDRPRAAIETAERWCRSEATIEEVRAAADAADTAAAATAAIPGAAAYAAASASAARKASLKRSAEIVRSVFVEVL